MKKDLLILSSKMYPNDPTMYDVSKTEDSIEMYYSKLQHSWSYPGKLAYILKNTGNGFIFKDCHVNQEVRIDYCQAEALRALFKLEDVTGKTFEYLERKK